MVAPQEVAEPKAVQKTINSIKREVSYRMWQTVVSSQDKLEDSNEIESVEAVETPEESNEVQEDNTLSVSTLKFLVIGNATPLSDNAKVASFEQVYAQAIQSICSSSNVPSLGMVEYGKGWSALSHSSSNGGLPM